MSTTKDITILEDIKQSFEKYAKNRTQFLRKNTKEYSAIEALLQKSYKLASKLDQKNQNSLEVLEELVLEEMDDEQIFQQLVLRNNLKQPQLIEKAAKLLAMPEQKLLVKYKEDAEEDNADEDEENEEEDELDDDYDDEEGDDDDDDDDNNDERAKEVFKKPQQRKKVRPSVVDDKFFKLDEMREFLEVEDAKEMRKQKKNATLQDDEDDDGELIDYFAEDLGDEEDEDDSDENNPTYEDFFDMDEEEEKELKKAKRQDKKKDKNMKDYFDQNDEEEEVEADGNASDDEGEEALEAGDEQDKAENEADAEEAAEDFVEEEDADELSDTEIKRILQPASDTDSDDDDVDDTEKPVSSHEQRQERLQARIREYEEIVLGEKPWQLKGEIQAVSRPKNSLLEEILDFESGARPEPVITEQTTRSLEDIIKQRIMDQAWDDPEPRVRPAHTPQEYRKLLVLDQEKSKESLAQIYEKEYQRELQKLDPTQSADATTAEELPLHREIRREMQDLFNKLDALSNFHFTPKPVAPEAKIITNTPAVAMEEVAPTAVSNANLLAPEEVYRGPKHGLAGKSERTRTDKNRERRKKKQKQRAINNALEARDVQRQKMGIPLTKKEESAKLLKKITKHRNVEKVKATDDKSALKSSKAFFNKLQDTTNAAVNPTGKTKLKRISDDKTKSAKKLKL